MLLNCGVGEDSWESLGLQGDPTSPSERRSVLGVYWKDWCWSWNSNTLATWCKELMHMKRSWCWERLKAGGEGDDRGWNGWMASLTQWRWVWVNSRNWWWTGRPGVLLFMGSQRVGHDWATKLNWTELKSDQESRASVESLSTPPSRAGKDAVGEKKPWLWMLLFFLVLMWASSSRTTFKMYFRGQDWSPEFKKDMPVFLLWY